MERCVTVAEPGPGEGEGAATAYCRALEDGYVLVVPHTPVTWTAAERAALLACERVSGSHKNIAYHRDTDRLTGVGRGRGVDRIALRQALVSYAEQITALLGRLLSPYAGRWRIDATSFRPQEESGRSLPWRARNDLLHIDAFPARPTNGDRILRVFTNMHATRPRCWVTTEPFEALARRFVGNPLAIPRPGSPWQSLRRRLALHAPAAFAPLLRRSPYDALMLRLHDHLKADAQFQATVAKQIWTFPPGSSWIAFTDAVAHAVLSGRCALEQTYFVPCDAMLQPDTAPVRVLERRCGVSLTDGDAGDRRGGAPCG